jgi:hypothetical protein
MVSAGQGQRATAFRKALFFSPVFIWALGGAATFLLNVVATWQGEARAPVKLLTNATVDLLLAMWWPATWTLWGVQSWLGYPTPLDLLFG